MRLKSHHNIARSWMAAVMLCLCFGAAAESPEPAGLVVQDPHYGEVLFHFYQQDYFTALTHLAAFRKQGRVSGHAAEAELLQGGLMLSWGQHKEAADIFERLLADTEDPSIRNRTWFYLAKVRYQRGYIDAAERAFEKISAPLPVELDAERYNLLARIYMDQGRFSDAAELLTDWDGPLIWATYARYNLGVALVRMGELEAGAQLLNEVGTMRVSGPLREELLGLRDRANVALGFAYLQADLDGNAKPILQRVRLNGPFSNKALLGVGWADIANQNYQQALSPWLELSQRELLDSAVQESLLAVPYAFARLDAEPLAAQYYAKAVQIFDAEIERLDAAIVEAGDGRLLNALLEDDDMAMTGWQWQLESLPDDDRTRYLFFTIADHRFHEGLKSYRQLIALNVHLEDWRNKLGVYSDMRDTRILAYGERLPLLKDRVNSFDFASMEESFQLLQAHSVAIAEDRDFVSLAPVNEQDQWRRLSALERNPAWSVSPEQREKHRVLKGLLQWDMEKEFRVRSWRQDRAMEDLEQEFERTRERYESLDQATASIAGTVKDFDGRIALLRPRIELQQEKLQVAMQNYAGYLQVIAEAELNGQKDRMLTYRAQARFALASIFDRMSARNQSVGQ